MHPSVTPIIRTAIKRRYELIPYTYSHCLKSHFTAVPSQRWTGWGYESDPNVWTKELLAGDTQYWFGDALLISGVYEPKKDTARVYLPKKITSSTEDSPDDYGFLNTNAPFQYLASGMWHEISSTWHSCIPVVARCGSAVPVGKNRNTTCTADEDPEFPGEEKDDWRGVEIFPPPVHSMNPNISADKKHVFESTWLEDDGVSAQAKVSYCTLRITYEVGKAYEDGISVSVDITKQGTWEPLWLSHGVNIILPIGEERIVSAKQGSRLVDKGRDNRGRKVWNVSVQPGQVHNGAEMGLQI